MANEPGTIGGESTDDISSPASAIASDVQWEDLSDESTRDTSVEDSSADAAASEGEDDELAPESPPAVEAPPQAPADAQVLEGTQAAEVQPGTTPPTEVIPPPPQLTPEQMAEQQRQWQEYQAQQVAQLEQYYAMGEEDALALATEPEKVLPKLAARLHMQVMQNVQAQMAQTMPNVLKTVQEATVRESKAKEEFFSAWPELRGSEAQVLQAGMLYRQMNPTASPQEAIEGIGRIVMAATGKQRVAGGGTPPAATRQQPAAPFKPAAGVGGAQHQPKQKTAWEDLIDD